MTGLVDGVDSRLPPLTHRTATFLKNRFNEAKADFTVYATKWSASGQNEPDAFCNFIPKMPSGALKALGKRMMVMFSCTRKGTPYEEEHFSNVCCTIIPRGAGRDEGSRQDSIVGEGGTDGHGRRKRAHSESEGIKEITSSLSKLASCYEGKKTSKEHDQSEKELKDYSCRLKKIKILEDVVKKLSAHPADESPDVDEPGHNSVLLALKKLQRDVSKDLLSDEEL